MNTRHAPEGAPFHQERYASSAALDRGLNGVLVKNRCAVLTDPREIELVWFIQYQSMQQGALEKFTLDLLAEFPERLGTPKMLNAGRAVDSYDTEQVRAICEESTYLFPESEFPLCGEKQLSYRDLLSSPAPQRKPFERESDYFERVETELAANESREAMLAEESLKFPSSYPAKAFVEICRAAFTEKVPELLSRFSLDPAFPLQSLTMGCFRDLQGSLFEYMDRWEKRHLAKIAQTEVGRKVLDAMEYSEAERALVLIEGVYGTGKTWPSKMWCDARPGKRRFVQCPSSNDNLDFFRTMAEPLGVSNAHSMKGTQMRARLNDVLQAGHLALVIDESHYLFPQASTRVALPGRVNWVMTALTNYGVPVILVATPQFMTSRAKVERNTFWAAGQLDGRISRYVPLPEELDREDLCAIARMHLPNGAEKSIKALVAYARASKKRLRGIEHGVKAARHVARLAGRDLVTFADIKQAIRKNVIPSDSALNEALSKAKQPASVSARRRHGKMYAEPFQETSAEPSTPSPIVENDNTLTVIPDRTSRSITPSLSSA